MIKIKGNITCYFYFSNFVMLQQSSAYLVVYTKLPINERFARAYVAFTVPHMYWSTSSSRKIAENGKITQLNGENSNI